MEFFLKEMGWTRAFLWIITLHTQHVLFSTQEHCCRIPNSSNFIKNLLILQGGGFFTVPASWSSCVDFLFYLKKFSFFIVFFMVGFKTGRSSLKIQM